MQAALFIFSLIIIGVYAVPLPRFVSKNSGSGLMYGLVTQLAFSAPVIAQVISFSRQYFLANNEQSHSFTELICLAAQSKRFWNQPMALQKKSNTYWRSACWLFPLIFDFLHPLSLLIRGDSFNIIPNSF